MNPHRARMPTILLRERVVRQVEIVQSSHLSSKIEILQVLWVEIRVCDILLH